jgi:hypothetical protein
VLRFAFGFCVGLLGALCVDIALAVTAYERNTG